MSLFVSFRRIFLFNCFICFYSISFSFRQSFHSIQVVKESLLNQLKITTDENLNSVFTSSFSYDIEKIIEKGPVPKENRKFLINGWRWHTKSVLRDISRFHRILKQTINLTLSSNNEQNYGLVLQRQKLSNCYDFVCKFNWKALIRVEKEIFFPWLEKLLPVEAKHLIDDILLQHETINNLTIKIGNVCNALKEPKKKIINNKNNVDNDLISNLYLLENLLDEVKQCAVKIQNLQVILYFNIFMLLT
jgi:hypothetical protein